MSCKQVLSYTCQQDPTVADQQKCPWYKPGVADLCAYRECLRIPPRCHCEMAQRSARIDAALAELAKGLLDTLIDD